MCTSGLALVFEFLQYPLVWSRELEPGSFRKKLAEQYGSSKFVVRNFLPNFKQQNGTSLIVEELPFRPSANVFYMDNFTSEFGIQLNCNSRSMDSDLREAYWIMESVLLECKKN